MQIIYLALFLTANNMHAHNLRRTALLISNSVDVCHVGNAIATIGANCIQIMMEKLDELDC